jgi:ADP-ribose pyrophosphatase YjhB (NUDIX family)
MPSHDHHDRGADPGYRFCPRCGSALEKRVVEAHDPRERLVCSRCDFIFYLDPKVAVGTVVKGEEGLLLLKRSIQPGYGKWVYPGGYVDRGETLEGAAVRETVEETGVRISLGPLLGLYSYAGRALIVIVYEGSPVSGDPGPTPEALEAGWFAAEAIPWGELAFHSTRSALRDYLKRHGMARLVPAEYDSES